MAIMFSEISQTQKDKYRKFSVETNSKNNRKDELKAEGGLSGRSQAGQAGGLQGVQEGPVSWAQHTRGRKCRGKPINVRISYDGINMNGIHTKILGPWRTLTT